MYDAEIQNFMIEFIPPSGNAPAKLLWDGKPTAPEIVVKSNYAVLTFSLVGASISGAEPPETLWVTNPVDWVDEDTQRSIEIPSEMTVRREHDQMVTIIDFNENPNPTPVSRYFILSLQHSREVFSFDPTIINLKPAFPEAKGGHHG